MGGNTPVQLLTWCSIYRYIDMYLCFAFVQQAPVPSHRQGGLTVDAIVPTEDKTDDHPSSVDRELNATE